VVIIDLTEQCGDSAEPRDELREIAHASGRAAGGSSR
jgi:hypothetical protein